MIVVRKQTVLVGRAVRTEAEIVRVGAVEEPSVTSGVAISLAAVVLVVVLLVV